jgi:hypothetical protein
MQSVSQVRQRRHRDLRRVGRLAEQNLEGAPASDQAGLPGHRSAAGHELSPLPHGDRIAISRLERRMSLARANSLAVMKTIRIANSC